MTGYTGIEGNGLEVEAAKALLSEAGYPGGAGFPSIEIMVNAGGGHEDLAAFIQQQWLDNLGINVTTGAQEWETYVATVYSGTFQIARWGWIGDYQDPTTFLNLFITDGGENVGKYANPAYDKLLEEAAAMPAGADRFAKLAEAEEILITQDQAIMPIFHYASLDMIDLTKWGGWYPNVMILHPVGDIYPK
jgi:oligopeptide transport system substrate-binding protein